MFAFLDTNVLIYAIDTSSPVKQARAKKLIDELADTRGIVLSTQVLGEFFNAATRKMSVSLGVAEAKNALLAFHEYHVVVIDVPLVEGAIDISERYRFSYWDSLIVEAALRGGAEVLYTEDLQHGQIIDGLRIENPFCELRS